MVELLKDHSEKQPVLRPLHRSTCVSQHPQSRTGGFCWCNVLLSAALADGIQRIRIREKTLVLSSTVLCTLSRTFGGSSEMGISDTGNTCLGHSVPLSCWAARILYTLN